jgi:hypothetical protein
VSPAKGLSFDAGHNLTVSGYFNRFDTRASDTDASVFLSAAALNSPYIALADGANFAGTTVEVADHVRLRAGYATTGGTDRPQWLGLTPGANPSQFQTQASDLYQRQARAAIAGITWDFADWGGVALTGTSTKEENSVLGGYTAGAFAIADTSSTMALGLSARMQLGDGWATTLAWNEGVTQLGLAANSLFSQADTLRSRAYGIAFTKHEIFGGDTVGFALTRPLHIYAGGATLRAATGVAEDQTLIYGMEHLGLASVTPETDLEFGYATSLFGGRMTLQADAAYQMDVEGEGGQDAVTAIARGAFRF